MADQDLTVVGTINYWCREKHYHSMYNVATDALRKYANDPVLRFFSSFALILEGRVQDGMRELDVLSNKPDINLCATLALIHGHRKAKTVDREAIQQLDAKLKTERKQGTDRSYYYAGLFLVHTEKYEKAKEYVDRALKMNSQAKDVLALKGWLELLGSDEASAKKSQKYFDDALGQEGPKCLDALFGKAKYLEMRRNYTGAIDLMNQAVVMISNFLPAIIEKMKLQLALQDWDQVIDTAQRASAIDAHCLQARRFVILHYICKEGNYAEAATELEELLKDFSHEEPQNAVLLDNFARVFCRVCGHNSLVLQQTYQMQERAVSIESNNASFMAELGYELLLQSRTKDALKCYQNAFRMDDTCVVAVTGIICCQLLENQLDSAAGQLEFLSEIKESIGKSAEVVYLSASLSLKKNEAQDKVLSLLNKTVELHFSVLKFLPFGTEYYNALNPNFLIQIATTYLTYAPQQPLAKSQQSNPVLQRCLQVLEPLCKAVPGLIEGLFLLGKVKFLSGDIDGATGLIQRSLELDQTSSDAHILMAQIHLHGNNFKMANMSLEMGLSFNFEVREHPVYLLIKARILKKQGKIQDALKTLQAAMALPGVKNNSKRMQSSMNKKTIDVSTNDRVSLFIELADAHRQLNEPHEAAKVMQDALNDFQGSGEDVRLTIANVDLSLTRGDVEGALGMLRSITPDQAYFVQAREKMAEIYLNYRKDKHLYASCYRELQEKFPSAQTALLLGDAYMNIQEPELAVEVYESALKKNPRDAALASKIGQALVKTHQFAKAISYYEAALKQGGQQFLRHDLAQLLIRLKHYEKAEKVLKQFLESEANKGDLETLADTAKFLLLLSQVYQNQAKYEDRIEFLIKAKEMQDKVVMRATVEQPDTLLTHKQFAASVCAQLAQFHLQLRDFHKAVQFYREALTHTESDAKIMLELAKLYMITGDLDSCHYQCQMMMKDEREKDAATVMMADLLFRKNEFEQALANFQKLLQTKPDHYAGLERVIQLLRRAGKLEECPRFLEMAEKSSSRATLDAGFNYCKGLYEWYVGNPNAALKHFNKARKDSDYGSVATYNMIEICLNPDNETLGGEVFEGGEIDQGAAAEKADSEMVAIKTAERLLRELKPKLGDLRHGILMNMLLIATKSRSNVEKALANFLELCNTEKQNVGALYGSAVAYMILKQPIKARNQLKNVAKATWNVEDADDLEKSWLLLADTSIKSGKTDEAATFLSLCLEHNKSCCKAYEYMGHIMETEQNFKEAAINYELAWKYGNKNTPAIGYKLAFNYLKAKRNVEAIEVCHQVLSTHPTYPKIRKEILDKARMQLRT